MMSTLATSNMFFQSCAHGRERRQQRGIQKRDLQAAVKHGRKELTYGRGGRRGGELRWKYSYQNIVYITDATSSQEITSWRLDQCIEVYPEPITIDRVSITAGMRQQHNLAAARIAVSPEAMTSHTVLVVDQSGSMRAHDMADSASRSDAVWAAMDGSVIQPPLGIFCVEHHD
jgi:hypothetical protein